jgi:NhaP-type Na+/H+ or K+/H+ antiporter
MDFHGWMGLAGVLFLLIALSSAFIRNLPLTTSVIYLIIGLVISPIGFGLIKLDLIEASVWVEHLTEIAVITSLFIGGLKLRLPPLNPAWFAAYALALPTMLFSIAGIALIGYYFFGLHPAVAVLLGSVLAPTDPVLASTISVENASDKDRMRYGLSGEAGFNDGMAFPFVIFALLWLENDSLGGGWIGGWALHRLVWAVPAGLILGYLLGKLVGQLTIRLRTRYRDKISPNDFLALALILLAYVGAEMIYAWGFLSVFAAGLGLRQTEISAVKENPLPEHEKNEKDSEDESGNDEILHPPAESIVKVNGEAEELENPRVAVGVVVSDILSFGNTMDRLLEFLLVLIVGIALAVHWNWMAIPLALVFFIIIRPVFAMIFLWFTPTSFTQKALLAWFGIRGIGSLYYLAYALNHGLNEQTKTVVDLTISTIALSIIIHGLSSQPILKYYEKAIKK